MARRPLKQRGETEDEVVVQFDILNEQVVIAAALTLDDQRVRLCRQVNASLLHSEMHKSAWRLVEHMAERKLSWDGGAVLRTVCADAGLLVYLDDVVRHAHTTGRNIGEHVSRLMWDAARMRAASGPLPDLLTAIKDSGAEPGDVRGAARRVLECFDGHGDTSAMPAPGTTSEEQAVEIRLRSTGRATYPYGIKGIDYEADGETPLLVPGAAPGRITIVTGVSGSGKSMLCARMVHGLWRQGRTVLYGAWEPGLGNALEVLACMECGLNRRELRMGLTSDADMKRHAEAMREIEKGVRLLAPPFRQGRSVEGGGQDGRRTYDTNERRIDLLAHYIERSGCEVVACDLLKRAFARFRDPSDEAAALYMVQDMVHGLGRHLIGVHQQLTKGEAGKKTDKRPSREGLKGPAEWFDVADLVVGVHREHIYHNVPDDKLELHVCKQRDGRYPVAIEFDYDGDHMTLANARQFDYRPLDGTAELGDGVERDFTPVKGCAKPRRPHLSMVNEGKEDPDDGRPY